MAKPAKKPTRYPKKFRQKLDRIAAARVEREDQEEMSRTLVHELLGEGSVNLMHGVVDDSSNNPLEWKLKIRSALRKNKSRLARGIKVLEQLPPWERFDDDETPAST